MHVLFHIHVFIFHPVGETSISHSRDHVQNGEIPRHTSWANFPSKIDPAVYTLEKGHNSPTAPAGRLTLHCEARGGRRTKDCSQTWSISFQFCLGKHFPHERGLPFYYLKIGFHQYLQKSVEMWYPNWPIGYWKKVTIRKEACSVHIEAIIHDHQGKGAS